MRETLQMLTLGLSTIVAGCTSSGDQALSEAIIREELAKRDLDEARKVRAVGEEFYKAGITMRNESKSLLDEYKALEVVFERRNESLKKRELSFDQQASQLLDLRDQVKKSQAVYLQLNKDTIEAWKQVHQPEEILFEKHTSAENFPSYEVLIKRTIDFNNREGVLRVLPIINSNNMVIGLYHNRNAGKALTPESKKQLTDTILYGKK